MEHVIGTLRTRDTYFWATHGGAELDLLALIKGKCYGFKFKDADAPSQTRSMQAAIEDLGLEHLLWVIYPGQQEYALDARISVISLDRVRMLVSP